MKSLKLIKVKIKKYTSSTSSKTMVDMRIEDEAKKKKSGETNGKRDY